jgi:heptosyltransferase-1
MTADLESIKKILIIQYEPLGDVLCNTGCLPYLRRRFPDARIDFLVVLEGNPNLDGLVTFQKKSGLAYLTGRIGLIHKIKKKRYDLIIDPMHGSGSAMMCLFSGAKYRLAIRRRLKKQWDFVYNLHGMVSHVRYSASMKFDLLKPLGIKEAGYSLEFFVPEDVQARMNKWIAETKLNDKKFIVFSPGSPVPRKQWLPTHYARLADLVIQSSGLPVILLWGPDEKEDADEVRSLMKETPVMAPPTDIRQAAALIRSAALLVCNDGGIHHLAAAMGTPSLALFGSTSPLKWCPDFGPHHSIHHENVDSFKDRSFGITPEEAFQKIEEIIAEQAAEPYFKNE